MTILTFASATTLDFIVPDNGLFDNTGGVSLDIRPLQETAVPEPPAMLLFGTALVLFGFRVRSTRYKQV